MTLITNRAKKFFTSYFLYSVSSLLKLSVFYWLAVKYTQGGFVVYNAYLMYSEVAMVLICSATVSMFAANDQFSSPLSAAIVFENLVLFVVFLIGWLFFLSGSLKLSYGISPWLIFILVWGRANNQIFCRYFLFKKSIVAAIINDLLGSYLWVIVLFFLVFMHIRFSAISEIVGLWIVILIINNGVNFFKYKSEISLSNGWNSVRAFSILYVKSFQFSIVNSIYTNVEKIIVLDKFTTVSVVSAYLIISKIVGFCTDITTGFFNSYLCSRILNPEVKNKAHLLIKTQLSNAGLFILVSVTILVLKNNLQFIFKNQLQPEYVPLFFLVIPLSVFINMRALNAVYFQVVKKYRYLNFSAFCQCLVLLLLVTLPINIFVFCSIETALIFMLLLADYSQIVEKKSGK